MILVFSQPLETPISGPWGMMILLPPFRRLARRWTFAGICGMVGTIFFKKWTSYGKCYEIDMLWLYVMFFFKNGHDIVWTPSWRAYWWYWRSQSFFIEAFPVTSYDSSPGRDEVCSPSCMIRETKRRPEPTLTGEWFQFVRSKDPLVSKHGLLANPPYI